MAIGIRILSDNLSGLTTNVTFVPQSGGTISLGTQVFPFNYISDYVYGTYNCYVPTYGYTYSLDVLAPTLTPTPTNTNTPTPTPTNTNTPTTTPTPTSTPEPLTLTLIADYTPGSIISSYTLVLNHPYTEEINVTFENLLNVYSGDPITIFTGVTVNLGELSGQTIVTVNEDYNNYNGDPLFSQLSGTPSGSTYEIIVVTPTPTPTPTPTNTNTPTTTPTPTNTSTPTVTQTTTQSPTNTETPTNTPTQTQTPTPSVTIGLTPTNTPTQTGTPTNTPTQTGTPTNTPTQTLTQTGTPTQTPTNTETPTNTPTQTLTQTGTPTNTPTNTKTPTNTPTPTQTPGYTGDGWLFYQSEGPLISEASPINNGNVIFVTEPSEVTYNPNYIGGTLNIYFNTGTTIGTSYLIEFQNLVNSGGTLTASQGNNTVIYSGTPGQYYIASDLTGGFFYLQVQGPEQMIQSASTPFVSGTTITINNFLLQEDGGLILQEDLSSIIIT